MSELTIPKQQIIDAGGALDETAVVSGLAGLEYERPTDEVPCPAYHEISIALQQELPGSMFTLKNAELTRLDEAFRMLGGARVMAGIRTKDGAGFLPGVILPDMSRGVRVGVLKSALDVRRPDQMTEPISDIQQLLLGKIAAEHLPSVGEHKHAEVRVGNETKHVSVINAAEIGHATLVAASTDPFGIHGRVHRLVHDGTLSATIAQTGATDIVSGHTVRPNEEHVYDLNRLALIAVVDHQQTPWPLDGNVFDLSAGLTHAAIQTQEDRPKPNLAANFEAIQQEAA